MVLCVSVLSWKTYSTLIVSFQATSKDGKEAGIELIQPPAGSKPGDKIYFEGPDFESES